MDMPLFLVPELMVYIWVPLAVAFIVPFYRLLSFILITITSKRV